jgi:hypothetical protein
METGEGAEGLDTVYVHAGTVAASCREGRGREEAGNKKGRRAASQWG